VKPKTTVLNLAELSEKELLKMIKDNNMGQAELFSILESLFEMFSTSLKFSSVVFKYGHKNYPDFVPTFLQHAIANHGIEPQHMMDILQSVQPTTTSVH
jgi:hypothetical protein